MSDIAIETGATRGRLSAALILTAAMLLTWSAVAFVLIPDRGLASYFLQTQDFPALAAGGAILAALAYSAPKLPDVRLLQSGRIVPFIAVALLLLTFAGTWLVFGDFALSRDEVMADFDSRFIARGLLVGPLAPQWAPFSRAMMPIFMLDIPTSVGWMSAYLPGNAALRAVGVATVGAEWINPILAALSALLTYAIGRRLWPDDREPALVALVLLASSAQVVATAMTPYAMTAHLAFNLLWLWCFLKGGRAGNAGAVAAGFVATGLHQIIFHPLFVLPFIVQLWASGRRRRALAYVAAYAAIGLFWTLYWQIVLTRVGVHGNAAASGGLPDLAARAALLLAHINFDALRIMQLNLLRFAAWQHLLLIPLAALGWAAVRRNEGIARPLAAGIVLTLAAMLLLLPWQGHGWGYRYLHGLIGSFCLLGGYGWRALGKDERSRNFILAAATAASVLVVMPLLLRQAHDFVRPYREAQAMIAGSRADVVLVDPTGLWYGEDLVRNRADLSNRPKVMELAALDGAQIRFLCRSHRVELFDARQGRLAQLLPQRAPDGASAPVGGRRKLLDQLGCAPPLGVGRTSRPLANRTPVPQDLRPEAGSE